MKLVLCVMKHTYLRYETQCVATADTPSGRAISKLRNKLFSQIYYWHMTI
jgi:hypothetical protein